MGDSPQLLHDFLSYKRRGSLGIHALNTALPRSSFCKAAPSEGGLGLSLPSTAGLCPKTGLLIPRLSHPSRPTLLAPHPRLWHPSLSSSLWVLGSPGLEGWESCWI